MAGEALIVKVIDLSRNLPKHNCPVISLLITGPFFVYQAILIHKKRINGVGPG